MVSYVTNLVELIGLGLAVDYSLLVVYRFREELARGAARRTTAIVRTMATAGRAVVFSGATVAIGLALLLLVPVPFIRSLGVGGFLVPLASIAAAATLQPALLSLLGRRGARRVPVAAFLRARLGIRCRAAAGRSTSSAASGRGSRARSCAGRVAVPRRRDRDPARAAPCRRSFLQRHARLDLGAARSPPSRCAASTLLRDGAGAGRARRRRRSSSTPARPAARAQRRSHAAIERLADVLVPRPGGRSSSR